MTSDDRPDPEDGPDPEALLDAAEEDLDFDDEDEDGAEDSEGSESEGAAPAKERKRKKKDDDPDAVLEYDKLKIPTVNALRKAMDWAFEGEEDATDELKDRYAKHARMVLEGNQRMNLTSIVDAKEVAAKHYLDSWRITRFLPLLGRRILDLGSGAGFPGLPLAMAEPNASVICVDSTKKRADFIQECIDALEIKNASAEWARAEEYLAHNKVDIVVLRAISSVRENVRTLRKVRHSHKDLIMLKGPSWSREVRAGEREAERLGFKLDTVLEHELPDEMGARAILVYRAPGGAGE